MIVRRGVYRFCLAALSYWAVETCAGAVFVIPPKVISLAAFLPPILGLMWGPIAAAGTYVGGLAASPELHEVFFADGDLIDLITGIVRGAHVFLAGYLPCLLWQKWRLGSDRQAPALKVRTLKKFLAVMIVTFAVTSIFRASAAPVTELEEFAAWLELRKTTPISAYVFACFINDFCWTVFIDLVWFFYLVSRQYPFHRTVVDPNEPTDDKDDPLTSEEHKALNLSMRCYFMFPAAIAYLDLYQIYGMSHMKTWLNFVGECLSVTDLYLVLMLYLLLNYRRSIMMEIVFLVALTVFLSAAVLGWGSSVAMNNLVKDHTDDSLHAMSVICRERLDRTFFCVRQAVSGMYRQSINTVESYERLTNDETYRNNYLTTMEQRFNDIARGTDGSIAYYLRLAPEIAGPRGGFSMAREDVRWEGALPPFVRRDPIDLSLYSNENIKQVGWYYIPFNNRCATWIEPYVDPSSKSYVISYVAPIFIDEKFVGVIGMDIDFNFIIQELRRMSIYDYGYVYIMNRNNIVLYHKDQPQGAVFQPNPEFQEMEIFLTNGMWLGLAIPLSRVHDERNQIIMHLITAILIVAMLISVGSISLASKAIRPLSGMTEAAKQIASGDLNVKISYESGNELGLLVRSIRDMAAQLEIYVYRDKLTGLRNAASYMGKRADLESKRMANEPLTYGVVIFDANFLKKVNDKYGHEAGNELIRRAGNIIDKVFANSPVYRVGGDEFAAILEGADYDKRDELLRKFDEETAAAHLDVGGDSLEISIARGLGIYKRGMDFADVTKTADDAMYKHKAAIKAKYGEEVR